MPVELLSVHIPKTAGTSFRRILDRYYGEKLIPYYDFFEGNEVPDNKDATAIHGHFPILPMKSTYPTAKTIAWLRHPVRRIASYHRFWLETPHSGNPRHAEFLAGDQSLESLAEIQAEEIFDYLGPAPLETLDFVGLVECFETDVRRFERWLSWNFKRLPAIRTLIRLFLRKEAWLTKENSSSGRTEITYAKRRDLERILAAEMQVYNEALSRRAKRNI